MRKEQIMKILLKHNILVPEKVGEVEQEAKKTNLSFPKILEKMKIIEEKELIQLIGKEIGVPFVDIGSYLIDVDVVRLIPQKIAKKYKLIPLFKVGNALTLAMVNPKDILVLDEVRQITGMENIEPVLSTEEMILEAIEEYYLEGDKIEDIIKGISKTGIALEESADVAPIIRIVNLIFLEGVKTRASDVHIEPQEKFVKLRYRVDGVLHEINNFPKNIQSGIISRIKVMANMDITESRFPQDGRISLKVEDNELDVRVSSFPTIHGQNIVMRLLDKSKMLLGLNELGFVERDLKKFEDVVCSPFGMILVTGPTGSGKTTTLYAALTTINSIEKNIITIDDPIEYELPLIRQAQVNVKAGFTFAEGLRSILRQDPDIIMVGEIRDLETASVAIHAALTGHMVLSTLHTNDAPSAVTRLIDMGIEPFLVSSTLVGVLTQRLVRVLCGDCKEEYTPPASIMKKVSSYQVKGFYRGRGCPKCKNTGFLGRSGIFEFLIIDEEIKEMIAKSATSEEIRKAAIRGGMKTLFEDGMRRAKEGITSIEEVLKVSREIE